MMIAKNVEFQSARININNNVDILVKRIIIITYLISSSDMNKVDIGEIRNKFHRVRFELLELFNLRSAPGNGRFLITF